MVGFSWEEGIIMIMVAGLFAKGYVLLILYEYLFLWCMGKGRNGYALA